VRCEGGSKRGNTAGWCACDVTCDVAWIVPDVTFPLMSLAEKEGERQRGNTVLLCGALAGAAILFRTLVVQLKELFASESRQTVIQCVLISLNRHDKFLFISTTATG
jgi:hypothetical protein